MRSRQVELFKLKELVESFYGFSLSEKGRQRDFVYAKKVYCYLCKSQGYTFQSIGDVLEMNHATVIHHYNSISVVHDSDREILSKCIEIWESIPEIKDEDLSVMITNECRYSDSNLLKAKYEQKIKELNKKISRLSGEVSELKNKREELNNHHAVTSLISDWSDSERCDFIEYRLKPYASSLKNKVFR